METGKELNDVRMDDLLKQQKETLERLLQQMDERFSELKYYRQVRSIIERYNMTARDFISADTSSELVAIVEELDSLQKDIVELSEQLRKDIRAMIDLNTSLNVISQSVIPIKGMISVLQGDFTETQPAFYIDVEQTDRIN